MQTNCKNSFLDQFNKFGRSVLSSPETLYAPVRGSEQNESSPIVVVVDRLTGPKFRGCNNENNCHLSCPFPRSQCSGGSVRWFGHLQHRCRRAAVRCREPVVCYIARPVYRQAQSGHSTAFLD